ncbi:mannosyl-glycoprotein endo-beta-N-acetylglucosaminidase [Limosilactobacillus coleohominis 101-4-CHN]|uniref:Mannosyl-glycoprotein endo-beta-N-acetylglucosaminidase n=2 Tax=Limosilactobacillus coleohominis TaxID=181675 RepID=C7XV31_9LACO|nr:mannosyl-glycoprotein endo-beta-N-acetylglucosaminidase [Limosilactobacillus coleohominis 101-4-CHN]
MSAWGKIYYFANDGSRATNQTINLGFGNLTFDSNGILTDTNSFIGSIVNGAIRGWLNHGVLPSLTISQAIIESGWGKSTLSSRYHNLFGIKGSYNGQSVNMPTYENYGNGLVLINDYFRAYPDNDASVEDHTNFFVDNSRYHNLLWNKDSNSVTYLVRADGYATATNYTSTLRNAISNYNLTRFDQVAFRAEKANV